MKNRSLLNLFYINSFKIGFLFHLFLGRVPGWGLTQPGGTVSPHLKLVELPAISPAQCIRDSDILFHPNVTLDKFCAGSLNSNKGVCQGNFVSILLLWKIVRFFI